MTYLENLIERVRAATGPDKILDLDIAAAIFTDGEDAAWWQRRKERFLSSHMLVDAAPEYTASIDAALALVERMLPGLVINATKIGDGSGLWQVVEAWHGDIDVVPDYAPMDPRPGALAFLEVLLSALSQQEANNELGD